MGGLLLTPRTLAQELAERFDSLGTEKQRYGRAPDGVSAGDVAYVDPGGHVTCSLAFAVEVCRRPCGVRLCRGGRRAEVVRRAGVRRAGRCDFGQCNGAGEPWADSSRARRLDVWVHVTRRAGRVQISVESATNQTTGTATTRGGAAGINTTRLEKYSIAGPVTDEWWQLRYDFSVGSALTSTLRRLRRSGSHE